MKEINQTCTFQPPVIIYYQGSRVSMLFLNIFNE